MLRVLQNDLIYPYIINRIVDFSFQMNEIYIDCIFNHLYTHLKSYSGNVTDGMTLTTESCYQYFVVFFNVV